MSSLLLPIYLIVFIGLIYLVGIRPQQRRRRQAEQLLGALSVGDDVVTSSGIHGRVTEIENGDTVLLEIAEDTDIRIAKAAIAQRLTAGAEVSRPT
jgi:preprotein translocase subunit YajC